MSGLSALLPAMRLVVGVPYVRIVDGKVVDHGVCFDEVHAEQLSLDPSVRPNLDQPQGFSFVLRSVGQSVRVERGDDVATLDPRDWRFQYALASAIYHDLVADLAVLRGDASEQQRRQLVTAANALASI